MSGYYSPTVKRNTKPSTAMRQNDKNKKERRPATMLVRAGRDKSLTGPFVNPPVIHASTVLFPSADDMAHSRQPYEYGRRGTPTSDALESAMSELEHADGTVLFPSGLSAATTALLACLSAGDRVLLTDSVYGPVRHFAETTLKRLGIEVVYYDPLMGAGIEELMTPNTRAVYVESPGSITLEMQDLSAIAAVAHRHNATVVFDNTWATPLFFRGLDHGADISILAGTKYISGHSDVMIGTAAARGESWKKLKKLHGDMGLHLAPDDIYLAMRGLRTLAIRLDRHGRSAMTVATWLARRSEVSRVLYPALPADAGHAIWKRDMTGASGLFSMVMKGWTEAQAKTFVDNLELFGIGASWGGFESLITLPHFRSSRTATKWTGEGPLLRLHIGLEDPDDLIEDLESSFAHVAASG